MKKIFSFGKRKKKDFFPNTSDTGSVVSVGYEIKEKDLSKLHRAASSGDVPKIKQLLKKHDINQLDKENRTPLHLACANGHTEAVAVLVESKSKLNLCDNDNRSPLMKAIQCQQERCATILLEHEADPNLVDIKGNAALHLAALIPSISIAVQLLEHGSEIDALNRDGCTPLMLAVAESHHEMVEFLITEGANVNAKDKNQRTSLMIAASNGHITLVKMLLQHDVNVLIKDDKGWTADDHAVMNGHHACSHLIIDHSSKNMAAATSPYHGSNKARGASMFSTPKRVVEGGFALGGPATDKGVTDEISQASESRASGKSADADSWPSDEDDLDFSPRTTPKPKPSLKQLLHPQNNVEKGGGGSSTTAKSLVFPLQSESDSDEESVNNSEKEDVVNHPVPKPLSQVNAFPHPVYFKPGSFTKLPQMTSTPLQSLKKAEDSYDDSDGKDSDSDEGDEGSSDEGGDRTREDLPRPSFTGHYSAEDKLQDPGGPAGRKALMSELGLEDDDVESPWDSESASESPRKQPGSPLPSPATQVHMQCISEVSNEDKYYSPSFLRPLRNHKMTKKDVDWLVGQREFSEKSTALELNQLKPFQEVSQVKVPSFSLVKGEANAKTDVMADLGLDDADDIEDASDWDSSSRSSKGVTPKQRTAGHSPIKLSKDAQLDTVPETAAPEDTTIMPPALLDSVSEQENGKCMQSVKIENVLSSPKMEIPLFQDKNEDYLNKSIVTTVEHDTKVVTFVHYLICFVCVYVTKNKPMLRITNMNTIPERGNHIGNIVTSQQPTMLPNLENNQDLSSDSELPWEERYEMMWVDQEKKDVKSHFKDITAELKEKFGEVSESKKQTFAKSLPDVTSNNLTSEIEKQPCVTSKTSNAEPENKTVFNELKPVGEQKQSNVENIYLFAFDKSDQSSPSSGSLKEVNDTNKESLKSTAGLQEDANIKTGKFEIVNEKGGKSPFTNPPLNFKNTSANFKFETRLGDSFSKSSEGLEKNVLHRSPGHLNPGDSKSTVKNVNEMHNNEDFGQVQKKHTVNHQPLQTHLDSLSALKTSLEISNKLLDQDLEQDMQRFKNEVGMLQMVFLNMAKDRAVLQKEVDDKEKGKHETDSRQITGGHDKNSLQSISGVSEMQIKGNAEANQPSKRDLVKGKNALFAEDCKKTRLNKKHVSGQVGGLLLPKKQQRISLNGDPLEVFDDSTLSEISQEDDERLPGKYTHENDQINNDDDMDDLTQSSDTATEEYESPTLTFRNAMLLIEQLRVNGQDSLNLLKCQNIIHEYERLLQKENVRYTLQAQKVEKLENEKRVLQHLTQSNRELKSMLEHQKMEFESEQNNLRFNMKQEEEKRKSAEMLYDKSKGQLRKKEDQCCKEIEEKQQLELTLRNFELELRSLRSSVKQVEEERNEAQALLSQERNARVAQEGVINSLKMKKIEMDENKKALSSSQESFIQPSETNENENDLTQRNVGLQEEIRILKIELEQVRNCNQAEENRWMEENDALKEKIDDLRRDLKMNEETLTQTVIQFNGQLGALKTEATMLCSKLDHEKQSKDRLETEVESLRCRLTSTSQELEKNQTLKVDAERCLQREKDEWLRSQDKLNHELSNIKEKNSSLSQQLSRVEAKSNSFECELHKTLHSLQEKTLLFDSTQRDLTQAHARIKDVEHALQNQKEEINKNIVKQESLQERLAQSVSKNMLLRQQLEEVQNKGIVKDKAVSDVQDRFTDIYSKLRGDTEKQIKIVEERNKDLISKSNDLREQLYKLETEKVERESTLRQMQQELADSLKKLSMSEASLEVITRYRNDLEEDRIRLQKELEKFKNKLVDLEDQLGQSEKCNYQFKNMLEDKERDVIAASQKVQELSSSTAETQQAVKQLEEHVQMLEIENAKFEATTKQQGAQIEVLQKELQESHMIRSRMEDLITTLQSSKIGLEDQLNQQVHKQTALSQSAQDSHNLWEEELKSRSRLGVRLTELDREKSELADQVENEKKKVKKLIELRKSMESRFEHEMKRSADLQRENTSLKKLVKTAKKKLKEYEAGKVYEDGSKNKYLETESEVSRFKEKIEDLSLKLERESLKYSQLESTNRDLQEQLSSMKKLHKSHDRLEKSKRQLDDEVAELKRYIKLNRIDQGLMEKYKKEIEEKGRNELRQKLEEVNLFLQTQASSQETLEQIRAANDASIRNQMEHRIQELESQLSKIKNIQQDSVSQKESTQAELERFKELYNEELRIRKSLAAKLDRANDRLADANAKLLNERQRNKSLIASSIVNGSPILDVSQLGSNLSMNRSLGGSYQSSGGNGSATNTMDSYLIKMQQELEKNITKELDQANAELETGSTRVSPVGSTATSLRNLNTEQDPVSRATQQYLEVLKKNYKI
ncbi:ankyrin repeat domain-containing protein 26 [Discoglossus pictus]